MKKGTQKFTNRAIDAVAVPTKRTRYRDDRTPGLILEINPSGSKIFRFRRASEGKEYFILIGRFPEWGVEQARQKVAELGYKLSSGEFKQEKQQQQVSSLTVGDLFERLVADMEGLIATGQRRLKSLDDYRSNWRTHTGPVFADRAAAKVTAEEARTFLAQIAKHNSGNIHNKCLTLMKRLYNFGIEERLVEANPFSRFKEKPETERERFIQSHEIKAFLESVAQEPQVYQDVCMMLLLTAQRKSCVFSMHWKEVDFFNKLWIIPSAKMKAHKGHSVPLTEEALSILQRRSKDRHESGYVFPSDRSDKGYITDKSGKSGFWRRITERAGLYSEDKSQRVTVHDVRRTVGSWQAMIGEPILNISKTLGHADIRTTSSVYAHLCTKEVRGSLERSTEALLKAGEVIRQEPTLADLLIERVRAMDEEEQLALWGYLLKQERAGTPLTLIKG